MIATKPPKKQKKIVTKIGDVFCVEFADNTNGYFQFIAIDRRYMNSSVIRAFKTHYPIYADVWIEDIIKDEIDFYAHTVLRAGIDYDTWYKAGKSKEIGLEELWKVIFGQTNEFICLFGRYKNINPLWNWKLSRVNEKWVSIGRLPKIFGRIVVSNGVHPYNEIVARMRYRYYTYTSNVYSVIKRIPRPDVLSYVRYSKNNSITYLCFKGDFFEKGIVSVNGEMTKIIKDDTAKSWMRIARKQFSDTNWRYHNFITEEELNKMWNSITETETIHTLVKTKIAKKGLLTKIAEKFLDEIIPVLIPMILLTAPVCESMSQVIRFSYDGAGNRIKRDTVTVQEITDKDREMHRFLKCEKLDKDITVKPNKNSGSIHIDIKDIAFTEPYHISLYAIDGYIVYETQELLNTSDIDISHLPKGVYILVVEYGNKSDAWKINYSK